LLIICKYQLSLPLVATYVNRTNLVRVP
jgi:hypothetical protein